MADQTALNTAKQNLALYTSDLPNEIKNQITSAWNVILQKTASNTADLKAKFLPDYFASAMTGPGMGTSEADLSPTQKLTAMGTKLGSFAGQLGKSQGVSDYLGGQMNDLYAQALDAMKYGQGTAQQGYQNTFGEYQLAVSQEEAAAARAATAAAAKKTEDYTALINSLLKTPIRTLNDGKSLFDNPPPYAGMNAPNSAVTTAPNQAYNIVENFKKQYGLS